VRAVLDANVLVSAAISPAGPPRRIITADPDPPVLTPRQFLELIRP